ncbi:DUF3613 domain-containing protein [Variovorax boronicumulans]|uniref:DUF3613 domain-containing protein n=1 Tax=Variovorax boronicumulans TaxID=436515 RepID=UPI0024744720|nr:DUF3613 domain-containing protein [Variovorax boronicumulans]
MFGLVTVLLAAAPAAFAQDVKPVAAPVAPASAQVPVPASTEGQTQIAEDAEPVYERLQVGDATQGLLAWQRGGEIASPTPRPIAGEVANRSYERYLKSFEFPIPERMSSIVKSGSGGGTTK